MMNSWAPERIHSNAYAQQIYCWLYNYLRSLILKLITASFLRTASVSEPSAPLSLSGDYFSEAAREYIRTIKQPPDGYCGVEYRCCFFVHGKAGCTGKINDLSRFDISVHPYDC
jgi:hypothetical protein